MKQSAYSGLSRRQALRGLLMTGGLLLVPGLARAFVPAAGAAPYVRTGFHMGTMVTISLARCSEAQAQEAVAAAFAECRRLEGILSRFDGSSPLSILNAQGALQDVPPELAAVLERARRIGTWSNHAFNPTVLPLVRLLEQARDAGTRVATDDLREALALVDPDGIRQDGRGVRLRGEGMGVTLDGIAKGAVVDALGGVLLAAGCRHFLINAGGDMLARGERAPGQAWRVAIEDPAGRGRFPQVLELRDAALATSGGYEARYDAAGKRHHLLRPETGESPELGSMSVLAGDAATADALATALSVMMPRDALALADSLPSCAALLVRRDGLTSASRDWPA